MVDNGTNEIQRAGSGNRVEQSPPQVIRATQRAYEAQGEAARQAEEVTQQVLRAGADILKEAGHKARTAAGVGESPQAKQALQEWAGLAGRSLNRNCRAVGDLMQCRTVSQVMGRQAELLMSHYQDLLRTSMTVMQVAVR